MLRTSLIAMLLALAPAAALAEDPVGHLAEEEEQALGEEAHEAHGGGPHSIGDILSSTEFLAAVENFGLLLLVFYVFGRKPIGDFLVGRRGEMERAINEAAAMREKAEARYKEYSDRLGQLDAELAQLRSDIEAAAAQDKQRIMASAEEAARRMRQETESLIAQHAQALQTQVRRDVVEAAVAAAQNALASSVNAQDQQRLADAFKQRVAQRAGDRS